MGKALEDTYQFYQKAHRKMRILHGNFKADEAQAKELQSFLYTIKSLGRNAQPNRGLVNQAALQIWEEAQKIGKLKESSILNRAKGQRGRALEKDIIYILLATVPKKVRKKVEKNIDVGAKHINIGAKYNNTFDNLMVNSDIVEIMKEIRPDLKTYATANQDRAIEMKSAAGKIDVTGPAAVNMLVNFQFDNPELQKYYTLLSNATFTAKNYASESSSFRKDYFGAFKRDLNADFPNLHLGNSDPYKAVYSSLQFLGYSHQVIESAFIVAYHSWKYKNELSDDIGTHIWHLRFAYELTGAGSSYIREEFKSLNYAKFLVYNDPASDFISVTSTKRLIKEVLLNSEIKDNPFTDSMSISKEHLKNISRSY